MLSTGAFDLLQGRLSGDQTARLAALVASLLSGGVVGLLLRVGLTLDDLVDDLCVSWQDFSFQTLGKGWKSLFNFDLYERISLS